ncbi:hypothetical protein [Phycicoccus sp.]|uniref:hypothetical protein n=1 Tax=Phycicoccus sp. TaxID=1902410 RepID=UPI002D053942|nr:hypothetical protein [Phycicoccus sp.]HMM95366.1 hypothetical protein [Phycicoccus sp.]
MSETRSSVTVGSRAKVWIGSARRGYWFRGIVIGIDTHPRFTGVLIRRDGADEDDPEGTAYATHEETLPDDEGGVMDS